MLRLRSLLLRVEVRAVMMEVRREVEAVRIEGVKVVQILEFLKGIVI